MSGLRKPAQSTPVPTPETDRVNAALKASHVDYQVSGKLDAKAFARAFSDRFPKTMAKLAE